jgi:hypothetical protein
MARDIAGRASERTGGDPRGARPESVDRLESVEAFGMALTLSNLAHVRRPGRSADDGRVGSLHRLRQSERARVRERPRGRAVGRSLRVLLLGRLTEAGIDEAFRAMLAGEVVRTVIRVDEEGA